MHTLILVLVALILTIVNVQSWTLKHKNLNLPVHVQDSLLHRKSCQLRWSRSENDRLIGTTLHSPPPSPSKVAVSSLLVALSCILGTVSMSTPSYAIADSGANDTSNTKIKRGGASTLQQGITKAITRGVNLDGSDFHGQNLKGVAFQQSIVRDVNFRDTNLYSASFFDATMDGSDFENADMTLANLELAQFNRANFKNAICREMYVVGGTNFEGIKNIENSDWTDTELNKYQRKYLCGLESAKGKNPVTGEDTRDSLLCP